VSDWEIAAEIAAAAASVDKKKLLERARSLEIESAFRASTAEFHALQITQRPAFLIDTEIWRPRSVFRGCKT